jgi:Ca2+-binding EF-hand superfamily protein
MGIDELLQDARNADRSLGGEVPVEVLANMVEKIATRFLHKKDDVAQIAKARLEMKKRTEAATKKLRVVTKLGGMLRAAAVVGGSDVVASVSQRPIADIESKLLLSAIRRIAAWAKRSNTTVTELFHQIDTDGSGSLDLDEFRLGLGAAGVKFDDRTMRVLLKYMDDSGDGTLDAGEFSEKMERMLEQAAAAPAAVLGSFCSHLHTTGKTAAMLFQELDEDGSGELDVEEFHAALGHVGINVNKESALAAMGQLDVDGDRTLQINELVAHLAEFQRQRRVFASTVLGNICDYVRRTRTSVVRVFSRVDTDGSGDLDAVELQEAFLKMGQDLSELEVEEVMRELNCEDLSAPAFLDKLKQFERQRAADIEKCAKIFTECDTDGSGELDREEVRQLAEAMGLKEQLDDKHSNLTIDKLIADIESEKQQEDGEEDNGLVSYDELLPWFLNVGRSYLPPPVYQAVVELDEPTEEELKTLFAAMDEDGSGAVNEQEVKAGTLQRWPYLETSLIEQAFAAADADGGGVVSFDEFDELVECLQFLNKNRHAISELNQQFASGVGDDEFYIGLTALGIAVSDAEATVHFDIECVRLETEEMTVGDFILWACRHECVQSEDNSIASEQAAIAAATLDLKNHMGEYGDIFFEDLAQVVFSHQTKKNRGGATKKSGATTGRLAKMRSAALEASERVRVLRTGIETAMKKHESFPDMSDAVIREFVLSCGSDLFFSGQNIITQGMLEDTFFVVRRGKAEVLVDDNVVGTVQAGEPLGELALMYGTRRSATVRCIGPCEVFYLNRAAYDTGIAIMPRDKRQGPLVKIMQRYWDLVSGPGGSNRPEVDYAVYLQYHLRITKTLTRASEMAEYDEDEQRQIAQEDWMEDTKRFGLKPSASLTLPMFFDSVYQLVDLWAADLDVSFTEFLDLLFDNIAEWVAEDMHWKFKDLKDVEGKGEKLDEVQNQAKLRQEDSERKKREAEEAAEKYRLQQEQEAHDRRRALKEKRDYTTFMQDCRNRLNALDDEEAEILRRLAAGNLSPEEEEALRRRLAEIAQERIDIKMAMLNYEQAELRRRLERGDLTPKEAEEIRRKLAALEQSAMQLKIDRLDAEEVEIMRRLASGLLSPEEEEELRRRLARLKQDRIALKIEQLDLEQREWERRLATGLLTPAEEEEARRRIAAIGMDKVALKLEALDHEETEIRRLLASGLLTPEEEAELRKRLEQHSRPSIEKERVRLQLDALQLEADELRRRIASGLLTPEEEEAARRRLAEIEEEQKRLRILYDELRNGGPQSGKGAGGHDGLSPLGDDGE